MERDLTPVILELIRRTATDLPAAVEQKLHEVLDNESPGTAAYEALAAILKNTTIARQKSIPICQDTGIPTFYIRCPQNTNISSLKSQIQNAVTLATEKNYLRPNAVHALTGHNTGNNLGDDHFPSFHITEGDGEIITIDLLLKGGGCENVSDQYSLPDPRLQAGRDLDGVRKVVLDAVFQAQGQGCAPGFLGVAIGGDRETSFAAAKEVLLRDDIDISLIRLEEQITNEANQLGIGPMGFGGRTTLLGTKVAALHRLPASYFVSISYMCWAFRHRRLILDKDEVRFE